jgi:hypothetical protein
MDIYRIETTVTKDGKVTIQDLPFRAGEKVEVTVIPRKVKTTKGKRYPLRGKPVSYNDPFVGVDEDEWEALK